MHRDRLELLDLLLALDGVLQSPRYHPEGDALFHSLQVFQLAHRESNDRELWAAALFHDVGKAIDGPTHDEIGADLLDGLVTPRVVWLVRHHLDLLREPRRTRRRHHGTPELADLERLRRWDLRGRSPHATVLSPEEAITMILDPEHETTPCLTRGTPRTLHGRTLDEC
ncbi:MAG: HD domain-containing protein [Myxococcales bacterium]|nr:HD domain-containing protein [Myxococcales bacterium]